MTRFGVCFLRESVHLQVYRNIYYRIFLKVRITLKLPILKVSM